MEVSELVQELADGRVRVFGDRSSRATRTEINLGRKCRVVVHKNTLQAEGIFAAAARFSEVGVVKGRRTFTLRIEVDPTTSQFNPIYLFLDGRQKVGEGYGQGMDLRVATDLLGFYIGGSDSGTSHTVIEWIRNKLK